MNKAKELTRLAQELADERPDFFAIKGPGRGDRDTAAFMAELRSRAGALFGHDYAEQKISGDNNLAIDFYFPDEATVVEVAFGLRNPLSEYERDVLKTLMAKELGTQVSKLLFITKPGGIKRTNQPGARAIADWAYKKHSLAIDVVELQPRQASG
jgi:hypothetical protein